MKTLTLENTRPGTIRIFLSDEDVTDLCFYAEVPDASGVEVEGLVKLYVRDESGLSIDVDKYGNPKVVVKTGLVRWEPVL